MKVTSAELAGALGALLDHLAELGHDEFEVADEYYWDVPKVARYLPYERPEELTLGQLSDDVEHVRAIAAGTEDPVAYALVWLGAVLRKVGEQTPG